MQKKLIAEAFGTFGLVFGGCGSAVLAAGFGGTDSNLGIGFIGVALAFGLTVLTMAYAVGHISGGHFNPAVTLGLVVGGRHPAKEALPYIITQVVAGAAASGVLYLIASDVAGFELGGFAANGFGEHSPGGYGMLGALVAEVVLTMFFLLIIMGSTDSRAPAGFAPIANRHRPRPHPHPPHRHPGHQPLGEPRPEHGPRPLRRRLGAGPALALLGRADHRRRPRRPALHVAPRREELARERAAPPTSGP